MVAPAPHRRGRAARARHGHGRRKLGGARRGPSRNSACANCWGAWAPSAPTSRHGRRAGERAARARIRFFREALRPPPTTDAWRALLAERASTLRAALDGLQLVEAANPREEALAIAVALREALETRGRTAALVTPDRGLARRVAAELVALGHRHRQFRGHAAGAHARRVRSWRCWRAPRPSSSRRCRCSPCLSIRSRAAGDVPGALPPSRASTRRNRAARPAARTGARRDRCASRPAIATPTQRLARSHRMVCALAANGCRRSPAPSRAPILRLCRTGTCACGRGRGACRYRPRQRRQQTVARRRRRSRRSADRRIDRAGRRTSSSPKDASTANCSATLAEARAGAARVRPAIRGLPSWGRWKRACSISTSSCWAG